jgi:hypothetical protein
MSGGMAGTRSLIWRVLLVTLVALAFGPLASDAAAAPGYELDPVKPSISIDAELPRGVAIDQTSQTLYVTAVTTDRENFGHGQIEQFDASGIPTANSPFGTGGSDHFTGVAVNPIDHDIYAFQSQFVTPLGTFGTAMVNIFSSSGLSKASFAPPKPEAPQPATDSAGLLYLPNDNTDTVQVFDSSGTLEESIPCAGCPGGGFTEPVSAAIDATGNLYVVDIASGGRVIKFKPSAGSYAYDSVLQSGLGATAVAVDPTSNDVLVGVAEGTAYHLLAYDASGTQIDDFGEGFFAPLALGAISSGQIAVNATTRKAYVADPDAGKVWIFNRVASISAPTATTDPATLLGQLEATLNSTVNPRGHGLTECQFKYVDHAEFLVNGFANASLASCPSKPGGPLGVPLSTKITGLTPATEYHYRIAVASYGGSSEGGTRTFITLPALPPTVTSGSASVIKQTTATIAGSVNPQGGPISNCHFEYTREADFQVNGFAGATPAECSPKKPSGTTSISVSAKLTSLTPATGYRFRVVATNNSGKSEATEKSFATLAETCETNPALCPPEEPPPTPVLPPVTAPLQPPATGSSGPSSKPLKCRRGFRKKRVRGKLRCVRIKKSKRRRQR